MRREAAALILFAVTLSLPAQERAEERRRMVEEQIQARGVSDPRVLSALRAVERHLFVPEDLRARAYGDYPLPIGEGQTISQPYIVGLMTETLRLTGRERVLEIGTGSGYQAAVLSRVAREVWTMEIREGLHQKSTRLLASLGFSNVRTRRADGYYGWPEGAPFDCIMITASVDHVPPPLLSQLADGGRLILPLGNPFSYQNLVLVTRKGDTFTTESILGVLFVPMTGAATDRGRH